VDYDAELQLHHPVLLRACAIRSHEHVLDVGCGTGQTTRDAARLAVAGNAFGIDSSAPMITRAREVAAAEGLRNIRFEQADAQVYGFPAEHFDVAISRYGTMFFADPVAAFRNIRGALRPNGRLVMMVWQEPGSDQAFVAVQRALAPDDTSPIASEGAPDPFSLADPAEVERILRAARFTGARFTEVREPVYFGPSLDAALDWVRGFAFVQDRLQWLDTRAAARALDRLREMLARHLGERGVWLDSRAWIVTAECG
jgi:SAM-dependent methyltransferase